MCWEQGTGLYWQGVVQDRGDSNAFGWLVRGVGKGWGDMQISASLPMKPGSQQTSIQRILPSPAIHLNPHARTHYIKQRSAPSIPIRARHQGGCAAMLPPQPPPELTALERKGPGDPGGKPGAKTYHPQSKHLCNLRTRGNPQREQRVNEFPQVT